MRHSLIVGGIMVISLALGCGGTDTYPVDGVVVDPEGVPIKELKGGTVEFESVDGKVGASGEIKEDGTFRMTSLKPGDGAKRGKHKVLIATPGAAGDSTPPAIVLDKYSAYATSGLEADVEAKSNNVTFKLERAKGKKGKS